MQLRDLLPCLSVYFFIHKTLSETIIVQGPYDMTEDMGLWANFTCSVSCDHFISWYVEGYTTDISTSCSNTNNNLMVCKDIRHECYNGVGNYSETLRVLAKAKHAGSKIAVQCAAVSSLSGNSRNTCNPFITYSRFALLTVNDLPDSTPTPTPCTTDASTVTETATVTETLAAITVTKTVIETTTATVMQMPSVTSPPLPPPNSATDSRRQLGKILTEMFMWVFTIGVGALLASMAVLR